MATKTIIANAVEICYEDDHIFRIHFQYNSNISLVIAKEVTQYVTQHAKDMDFTANLADVRDMAFIDSSARKHFAEQSSPKLQAVAIVINSKFQTALANLYFKIAKPRKETKLFDNPEEALEWLNSVLSKKIVRTK